MTVPGSELQAAEQRRPLLLASYTLGERLGGRDNNLNLLRMLAAFAVLVSHAFPISYGQGTPEPLEKFVGLSLGSLAVCIFFGISGLLITLSFERRKSIAQFVVARFLRLYPGLIAVLAITVAIGAMITTMPIRDYLSAPGTWTYIPKNLSLAVLQFSLPGVFQSNPLPGVINGSLWTLFYEVVCYGAVLIAGLLGLFRSPKLFSAIFLLLTAAFMAGISWQPEGGIAYKIDRLIAFAWPFGLGMMAYLWRDLLRLDIKLVIVLWLVCIPAASTLLFLPLFLIALLYSVAWIAFVPRGPMLAYNRLGDYSYGVYIFAYPSQQLVASAIAGVEPLTNVLWAAPLTLTCSIISWHLVEKRALSQVPAMAGWINTKLFSRAPQAN